MVARHASILAGALSSRDGAARGADAATGIDCAKEDGPYVLPAESRRHSEALELRLDAVSGGDSLYLVGKVLGHRQFRTTERYAHLKDDPLRAVANRTSERIAAIMRGSKGTKVVSLPSSKAAE
jgi:site-specific recombinase XerD